LGRFIKKKKNLRPRTRIKGKGKGEVRPADDKGGFFRDVVTEISRGEEEIHGPRGGQIPHPHDCFSAAPFSPP